MEEKEIKDEELLNKEEQETDNKAEATETANEENTEEQQPEEEKDPLELANEQIEELKDKYLRSVRNRKFCHKFYREVLRLVILM